MTNMMHKHRWLLRQVFELSVVVSMTMVVGCGHTVDHKISDRVKAALPGILGPADSYDVKTATDSLVVLNGKIRSVEAVGQAVRLSPNITVDELTVTAHDIVVDPSTRRLSSFGQVDYSAVLGQANLDRYLALTASRPGRPDDFSITLGDNDASVGFKIKYLGINVPMTVRGTVQPENSNASRLDFIPSSGALGFLPIPAPLVRVAIDRVNPIMDVSKLRVPLTVSEIHVRDHALSIAGTAKITPQMLASAHQ